MKRVANRDASWYVNNLEEFKGSNTFANWEDGKYIVYSYGTHWILYMNINGEWFGCSEKRSVSTSKQSTQLHPNQEINYWLTQKELQNLRKNIGFVVYTT